MTILTQIETGPKAKLSRSEARALRALVTAAIPMYALQLLAVDRQLGRGMVNLDMERLARRGLVVPTKIVRRHATRWMFEASDDGRAWVKAHTATEGGNGGALGAAGVGVVRLQLEGGRAEDEAAGAADPGDADPLAGVGDAAGAEAGA